MWRYAAAVFGIAAAWSAPSAAQNQAWAEVAWERYPWGTFEERGRRGAHVCNATDEGGGEISCLRLMCRPGEPLVFVQYLSGDPVGPRNLILTIDDTVRIRMTLFGNDNDYDGYAQVIHPRVHGLLIDALRNGRWVVAQEEGNPWSERYRLTGSSRMIDHALRVCPVLHPDSPVTVSPPLANPLHPAPPPAAPARQGKPQQAARPALPNFGIATAPAVSLPAPGAAAATDRLDALTLRDRILNRRITWGDGSAAVTFHTGGRFAAEQNGHPVSGNWQMVTDGRICWNDGTAQGCFRFLERGTGLALRLETGGSTTELGPIRFE